MEQDKKVSIVMASYNYGKYLDWAIKSVFSQTYKNWELIVVDDGSTDNSVKVIKNWIEKNPKKIVLLAHLGNVNKGIIETYKLGIKNCSGEFIAFLESDDFWLSQSLELKIRAMKENSEAALVYSNVKPIGRKSETFRVKLALANLRQKRIKGDKLFCGFNNVFEQMIPTFSSVVIKKEFIKDSDFYGIPEKYRFYLDWWLWSHVSTRGKFFYLDKKLTFWRIHKDSYIRKNKKITRDCEAVEKEFTRVLAKKLALEALIEKNEFSDEFLDFLLFDNGRMIRIGEVRIKENHLNLLKFASFLSPLYIIRRILYYLF